MILHYDYDVGSTHEGKTVVRLAVVSHSKFLRNKLKKYFMCDSYFVNNGAMILHYDYDVGSAQLTERTSADGLACVSPLGKEPAKIWGKERNYACPKDYARCFAHGQKGPSYMGKSDGKPSDKSPWIRRSKAGQECCIDWAKV